MSTPKPRRRRLRGKKLLVATVGIAALTYTGCGPEQAPPGNLVAPVEEYPPGNLVAPPEVQDDPPGTLVEEGALVPEEPPAPSEPPAEAPGAE